MKKCNDLTKIKNSKSWQVLQQLQLFSSFAQDKPQWPKILDIIGQYLQQKNDPIILLSALFQISGVYLPLKLNHNITNRKQQQIVRLLSQGKLIAAHCMSEQSGGTDIFSMKTKAHMQNNHCLINGEKTYICNAPVAEVGLLYALSDQSKPKPYNLSCFLIDMNNPGITVTPINNLVGLEGLPMGIIQFKNYQVPKDMLISKEGMGQSIAFMSTTFERLIIPMAYIGIMQQFYQNANAQAKVEIYRLLCSAKSLLLDHLAKINLSNWQRHYIKLGCLTKWHISECYITAAKLFGDKQAYLDARSSWIYSGTNDSLKDMLARLL